MDETTKQFRFHGHMDCGDDERGNFIASIEYEQFDPSTLKIELLLLGDEEDRHRVSSQLLNGAPNFVWLSNDEAPLLSVEVLGIERRSSDGRQVRIGALAVQIGLTEQLLEEDCRFYLNVELTPSAILVQPGIYHQNYDGITFRPIIEGDVQVQTSLGSYRIGQKFTYFESENHGDKVTNCVTRLFIGGEITVQAGADLFTIHEAAKKEVADICLLLSLCYRQPVDCYEFTYSSRSSNNNSQLAVYRRRLRSHEYKLDQDELVNYRNLVDGGLNRLLHAFNASTRKDEIRRVISFLGSSYKTTSLEPSYFLAYSALDLSASLRKSTATQLVSSRKWKTVSRQLERAVDAIAESEGLVPEVINLMKLKIPELRRAPSTSKISQVCADLGVKTEVLWPELGFTDGLKEATRVRNRLFHAASLGNGSEVAAHLVRVRTLVERILLKVLSWPDEHIWTWYDQELMRINNVPGVVAEVSLE